MCNFRYSNEVCVSLGIRQLQLILLKLALILGVEVHTEVTFEDLLEPSGSTGTVETSFSCCNRTLKDLQS